MPSRASLTLNVPLSRAQLAQELAQDTGLADNRQLTGEQCGRPLSQADTNFCLPHLACVSGLHQPRKPRAPLSAEGPSTLMRSIPPKFMSPPPPDCHHQSFSKTWSPCNFQFVRNIKIEGYSLQAAHIESDAPFCVMSDHWKRN